LILGNSCKPTKGHDSSRNGHTGRRENENKEEPCDCIERELTHEQGKQ